MVVVNVSKCTSLCWRCILRLNVEKRKFAAKLELIRMYICAGTSIHSHKRLPFEEDGLAASFHTCYACRPRGIRPARYCKARKLTHAAVSCCIVLYTVVCSCCEPPHSLSEGERAGALLHLSVAPKLEFWGVCMCVK